MTHEYLGRLKELARVELLSAPTPLEPMPGLSKELGITLLAKRDDLTGIGAGGNKLRKLELLVGKAIAEGATWLMTTGGPQSNHARLTAAVAARLGLGCTLLLKGVPSAINSGNLLLDHLFGADVRFIDVPDYPTLYKAMDEAAEALRAKGERPAQIPLGGATAEGTAAYVGAVAELAEQMSRTGFTPDLIVVAAGTVSTFAGLELGCRHLLPQTRVAGISVSWSKARLEDEARRLISETAALLEIDQADRSLWLDDGYIGPGYAQISKDGLAAVRATARRDGVVLDSTYTGKAMAGLMALVSAGQIKRHAQVVFVHTGGLPELFARNPGELLS